MRLLEAFAIRTKIACAESNVARHIIVTKTKISEYDKEIPQSHAADQPMAAQVLVDSKQSRKFTTYVSTLMMSMLYLKMIDGITHQ